MNEYEQNPYDMVMKEHGPNVCGQDMNEYEQHPYDMVMKDNAKCLW